jgi:formamidopyrimidine-DNA glycosylase
MPELPEVEFARRTLVRWLAGREVVHAHATRTRTFRGASPEAFERIRGRLLFAERKGKYLMLGFEDGLGALAHLGMTGKFVKRPSGAAEPYSRARLELDSGEAIHFRDPRLFGRIEPAPSARVRELPVIRALGRDPLNEGLSGAQLAEAVGRSGQALKVALMDQSRIAGLGNIHAAEALYRAKLNPARAPRSLSRAEWSSLARSIHATFAFAFEAEGEGDEIDYVEEPGAENPFLVYGRAGERCGRGCGARVRSFVQGGRTTHYCPRCQPVRRRA